MNIPVIGLFAGLLVAVAAAAGGFIGFLLALVLGATGFAVGLLADGGSKSFDDLMSRRRRG
ncbi:hypothetical protein [Kribbella pratensis]|jgi:uncharacterized membrane protein|uniref:Small integral membrane protein DUF2273 n=1 Tax=Kribbella pratensis TaxID=2512112 RepID=A0A4R8BYD5_9ACTN|nr:hypothetical protein [Kribbella pratensis]TDW66153.1 hypothetical protein EV653_6171 [Kribbella pratensis]